MIPMTYPPVTYAPSFSISVDGLIASVSGIGDAMNSMIGSSLECLVMTNVRYLGVNPGTPSCRSVSLSDVPSPDDAWGDVGVVLQRGSASCVEMAAWRAAEIIMMGGCVVVEIDHGPGPAYGWKVDVAWVTRPEMRGIAVPAKIRARRRRLLAHVRRNAFAIRVPGIEYETEAFT